MRGSSRIDNGITQTPPRAWLAQTATASPAQRQQLQQQHSLRCWDLQMQPRLLKAKQRRWQAPTWTWKAPHAAALAQSPARRCCS